MCRCVHKLLWAEAWKLFYGAHEGFGLLAKRREALQPLEKLNHGSEMPACSVDGVFSTRAGRAILVMFRLAIVGTCPVFQAREIHADLHGFGPCEVLPVRHDPIEELCAKPVEQLR